MYFIESIVYLSLITEQLLEENSYVFEAIKGYLIEDQIQA